MRGDGYEFMHRLRVRKETLFIHYISARRIRGILFGSVAKNV